MLKFINMNQHKIIKIVLIMYFILMFFLFAINNTFDFNTNYQYIKHVLSMDTTSNQNSMRAIHNPIIYLITYLAIIIWQYLIFFVGLTGLRSYVKHNQIYLINYALLMAISLYFFGYLIIASEWFLMWQSKIWNGQNTAFQFTILFILLFIIVNSQYRTRN